MNKETINEIPDWMIIDAVRYVMGRRSTQVSTTCEWLISYWDKLSTHTKSIIKRDLEEQFALLAGSRLTGNNYYTLGDKIDIEQWEKVRGLWKI